MSNSKRYLAEMIISQQGKFGTNLAHPACKYLQKYM